MRITNKDYAEKNQYFILCCEKAGIEPTARQASKFRNKRGLANQYRAGVSMERKAA